MKLLTVMAALLAAAFSTHAQQVSEQIRQATMKGSRGASGKCTIEVRVDMTAEVDIYGSTGRLRTLAGQPATWTRMECTDALPYGMSDFRFKGIDGRGKVQLVQDPRNNNGVAVIRIEDSKSGSEGYTFDLEWSGATGGAPTGGFPYPQSAPAQDGTYQSRPGSGRYFPGRSSNRAFSSERAIDLCRSEVRARAERDYSLRNIDITSAAVDTNSGFNDQVTGTFTEALGRSRRRASYRFVCALDNNLGQIRCVDIARADGGVFPPSQPASYDQSRVLRACQDAVVARTAREGYQNVNFVSTAVDSTRSGWVSGSYTATRGPVSDTFDFSCSVDLSSAAVRDVRVNRR